MLQKNFDCLTYFSFHIPPPSHEEKEILLRTCYAVVNLRSPRQQSRLFAIRILCEKACCPLRQLTYDITAKKFRQAIFEDNFTFFKEIAGNFPFYHVYFAHKRARAYAQNLEIRKKAASLFGQGNRNTFIAFSDTGLPDR